MGATRVRASHQSQPRAQLPFGHLNSNLALMAFAPGLGLSGQHQKSPAWIGLTQACSTLDGADVGLGDVQVGR